MELSRSIFSEGDVSMAIFLYGKNKTQKLRQSLSFDVAYISGDKIDSSAEGGPITLQAGNYEVQLQGVVDCDTAFRVRFRLNGHTTDDMRLLNTFSYDRSGHIICTTLLMLDGPRKLDVVLLGSADISCQVHKGTRLIVKYL
jgi:hypothetical protein